MKCEKKASFLHRYATTMNNVEKNFPKDYLWNSSLPCYILNTNTLMALLPIFPVSAIPIINHYKSHLEREYPFDIITGLYPNNIRHITLGIRQQRKRDGRV